MAGDRGDSTRHGRCHRFGVLSGSVPHNPDAAIARSGSARIAAPSSAVRRCGIVISRHIRDRIRIARCSAAHLDRRSCPPDAPMTLWTTREIECDRFRSADGRVDRSVPIVAGNPRRTVALTDSLDASPHSGPGRSLVSGRATFLRDSDTTVSRIPGAIQSALRRCHG